MWSTPISSPDVSIVPDETIHGLTFSGNQKLSFPPVDVAQSFPNLLGYDMYNCLIKTISKSNFVGLSKLKGLWLNHNHITRIDRNVFEDLVSLEFLTLSNNRIREMNGWLFERLNSLKFGNFAGNACINQDFVEDKISLLKQIANSNCGFDENNEIIQEKACDKINLKLAETTAENTQHLIKISALESKLNASEAAYNQSERHIALFKEIYEKLDAQRNETFAAKTEELRNTVESKMRENSDLIEDRQRMENELLLRAKKIKALTTKIDDMSRNIF